MEQDILIIIFGSIGSLLIFWLIWTLLSHRQKWATVNREIKIAVDARDWDRVMKVAKDSGDKQLILAAVMAALSDDNWIYGFED